MLIILAFIIGQVIQLLIGSLVGAVILRAACALFNKWFGKEIPPSLDQPEFQTAFQPPVITRDPQSAEAKSPYAPPMAPLKQSNVHEARAANAARLAEKAFRVADARGVPEPDFGKAFLICFLASIVNMVLGFVLGLVVGVALQNQAEEALTGVHIAILICFSTAAGFIVLAVANTVGLPTSFPRALGVTGLFLLVAVAVGILIGVVIFAISSSVSLL